MENFRTLALHKFHDIVLGVLERLVPSRKKKTNSRPKMHRMRRLLFKRLSKPRKPVKTAQTISSTSLQKVWDLEDQLSSDYSAVNKKEDDYLNDIKCCPADIEKAWSQLKGTAAVPAILLKNCRTQLSQTLYQMEGFTGCGIIPVELLFVLI